MDTFFARNRLSAYLDGTLPESEAAEVEAAIAEDTGLREEFDEMRRAVELLRRVGPVDAPEGFHARVMAQIESEPAPGGIVAGMRRVLNRVPVEAMALAAAAVIVVMVIQGRGDDALPDAAMSSKESFERELDVMTPSKKDAAPPAPPEAVAEGQPAAPAPAADGDLRTVATASAPGGSEASKDLPSKEESSKGAELASAKQQLRSVRGADAAKGGDPYYSDWEQQGTDSEAAEDDVEGKPSEYSDGIEMARPMAYRLSLADTEILYQLSAAAESAGGRLTDAMGNAFRARELEAGDTWLQVHVVVPRDNQGQVQGDLGRMGAVPTPPPADTLMYGSDWAVFVVQISHNP